jgi:hypothetical protein
MPISTIPENRQSPLLQLSIILMAHRKMARRDRFPTARAALLYGMANAA